MPIAESLAVGKAIIEFLGKDRVWRWLYKLEQPAITIGLLGIMYAGYFIMREGSILEGLHVAFIQTRAQMERSQNKEKEASPEDIIRAGMRQKMIMNSLERVLPLTPSAARVRLGILHTTGINIGHGTEMLRYDVPYAVAAKGYTIGELFSNAVVVGLGDLFAKMNVGDFSCHLMEVALMPATQSRERIMAMGVKYSLACPLRSAKGNLYGIMFFHYQGELPPPAELTRIEREAAISSIEIGAALNME